MPSLVFECLWDMGRIEDASGEMRKAEELDPMSAVVAYNVAIALAYSRDKKGALGRVEKLRAIDPSAQYADLAMSYILYRDGDLDGALRYQRLAQEKKPGDMWGLARLGMLCGMTGRKEEARGALDRIAALPDGILIKHHQIAMVYAGLGENEEVFRELEKAFSGQALVHRVLRFQFPRGVREDPRFASFFTRVGLPVPHDEQDIP